MLGFIFKNKLLFRCILKTNKPIRSRYENKSKIFYKKSLSKTINMVESLNSHLLFSDEMFLHKNIKEFNQVIKKKFFKIKNIETYSPLHNHSDLSLLDGASRVSELVSFAKELRIKSLSITDHGVMHAIVDLFKECEKAGIKPIAGNEMYVINGSIARNYKKSQLSKYHQLVLALNEQGYRNLVKLTTISHLNGWQGSGAFGRPCISKKLIFKYKKNIVFTSACLGGEVGQHLLDRNFSFAKKAAEWYKYNFNDFFFLELQDHGHREDRAVNTSVLKIANDLKIRLFSTNDSHFTKDKDVEAHDTLLCIQTGKPFDEPGRMRYSGTEFLKSSDEMKNMYQDHIPVQKINSALLSTVMVSNQAENYSIWAEITIPTFEMPQDYLGFTSDEFMDFLGYRGLDQLLKDRFINKLGVNQIDNKDETDSFKNRRKKYYERLNYELESIKKMGFSTYFLVVWDFIDFARKNNVPIGSGRGSVAGSLVAYALGITNIDPIEYDLLFERFLNPDRKSMPDIDTDFSIDGRDMIIDYVSMKYGQEKVAQIITFNRLTSKAVLKDMGRSFKKQNSIIEKMSESIPISRGKPLDLKSMISTKSPSFNFRQNYLKNEELKNMIDKALNFEGMNKTTAVHAAGVVISSRKLDEIVPLTRGIRGEVMTQYPMEDIEYLGLLKMDFLGLKNLSMVENVVNFVNYRFKNHILSLDSSLLEPHFDNHSYDLLARGNLDGVFQLDASHGMKDIVMEIRPNSIQDISSILALYRPGPLDTGLIPRFIKRKRKTLLYKYDYPELKQTLGETYGILLYQEQIMKVAQELGGYSMSQADILRRAMGKKKISEMRTQEKIFIEGCLNNSFEKMSGQIIFNQMLGFAEYCFNKSHSIAYSYTTYQTAWLKSHWPVEFFCSLMNVHLTDFEKIDKFIYQAASIGIFVRNPDINSCDVFFTPDYSNEKENFINFGLGAIKNIGEIAASIVIVDRKIFGGYLNLIQIVNRLLTKQLVSRKLIETLIVCGCIDKIGGETKRKQILTNLDKIIEWINRTQKIKYTNQPLLLDLESVKNKSVYRNEIDSSFFDTEDSFVDLKVHETNLTESLTGSGNISPILLNQSELLLLLGMVYNFQTQSIEIENGNPFDILNDAPYIEKSLLAINRIEKTQLSKKKEPFENSFIFGVILEVQEYRTSSEKKVIKLILEDFYGIIIGIIFEKNQINFENEMKSRNNLKKYTMESTYQFYPGNLILGFGNENNEMFEYRKIFLSRTCSLYDYKIFIINLSIKTIECLSVHLLLKLNSTIQMNFFKANETEIPLFVNIIGKQGSEILKTGLFISESNLHIVSELFKRLGFECTVFQFSNSIK